MGINHDDKRASEFTYRENTNTSSRTSADLRKRAEQRFPVGRNPRTHFIHQRNKSRVEEREIEFITPTWSHPENANLQRQKFHAMLNHRITV